MTLTPEERANALADEIFASGHGWSPMGSVEATKLIAQAIREAENAARLEALTSVRDAIDRSDSANDYPAWKSEALIVDMINAMLLPLQGKKD